VSNQKEILTYSALAGFRDCREWYNKRYNQHIVPLEKDWNLRFGTMIHKCLEVWHSTGDLRQVYGYIEESYPNRAVDEEQQKDWHYATAMMRGYADRYPTEEFEVIALEKKFQNLIINPETGAKSRSFLFAGKVDGVVKIGSEYYLIEHKTTSVIDGGYLDKLWTDFQIKLYVPAIEKEMGITISGVIYNILVKPKLRQGKGETEAEYEERLATLIAKSKTGKSNAKRKMPEDNAGFLARLAGKYDDPAMFHREKIYFSRDQDYILQAELWELTQAILDARRRGIWYQNTNTCFKWNRPCAYYSICRSGGNQNVIDNFYEIKPPHEELEEESKALSI